MDKWKAINRSADFMAEFAEGTGELDMIARADVALRQ